MKSKAGRSAQYWAGSWAISLNLSSWAPSLNEKIFTNPTTWGISPGLSGFLQPIHQSCKANIVTNFNFIFHFDESMGLLGLGLGNHLWVYHCCRMRFKIFLPTSKETILTGLANKTLVTVCKENKHPSLHTKVYLSCIFKCDLLGGKSPNHSVESTASKEGQAFSCSLLCGYRMNELIIIDSYAFTMNSWQLDGAYSFLFWFLFY